MWKSVNNNKSDLKPRKIIADGYMWGLYNLVCGTRALTRHKPQFHMPLITGDTSWTKASFGADGRLFIATTVPSCSRPLYTSPNVPCPMRVILLKLLVAAFNSSKLILRGPPSSDTPPVRGNSIPPPAGKLTDLTKLEDWNRYTSNDYYTRYWHGTNFWPLGTVLGMLNNYLGQTGWKKLSQS